MYRIYFRQNSEQNVSWLFCRAYIRLSRQKSHSFHINWSRAGARPARDVILRESVCNYSARCAQIWMISKAFCVTKGEPMRNSVSYKYNIVLIQGAQEHVSVVNTNKCRNLKIEQVNSQSLVLWTLWCQFEKKSMFLSGRVDRFVWANTCGWYGVSDTNSSSISCFELKKKSRPQNHR